MYTQCPHCNLAFRVTAPDLQRASGRVFCASCSREFNALETLSEDPPAVAGVADEPGSPLETLNEFTGEHEIRIEDTGVEWRVIDEDEADEDLADNPVAFGAAAVGGESVHADEEMERLQDAPAEGVDSGSTSSVRWYLDEPVEEAEAIADAAHFDLDVQRYDDNTPLPEDFAEEDEPQVFRRRAEDQAEPRPPEADEAQVDLALGEPDDWMDLLDEVAQRNGAAATAEEAPAPAGQDPLADTDAGTLAGDDEDPVPADFPSDIDTQFDLQALEMGIDLTGSRNLALEEEPRQEESGLDETDQQEMDTEKTGEEIGQKRPEDIELAAPDEGPPEQPPPEEEIAAAAFEEELSLEGDEQKLATDSLPEGEDSEEAEARRLEQAFEQELAAAWTASADEVVPREAPPVDAPPPDKGRLETMRDNGSPRAADAPDDAQHYVPPQTEEEMTINRLIDQDLIRLAEQQNVFTSGIHSRIENAPHVETIIMEGDFVRNAVEDELAPGFDSTGHLRRGAGTGHSGTAKAGAADSPEGEEDDVLGTYASGADLVRGGRRRTDPASYKVVAGVAAFALVLAAQVVHAWRDSLATYPMFDKTIGSVYRLVGEPLNPDWNIKEWQFEATSGRTGETDDVLTISSRVANGSSRPLPYPLLHVSLTDRWEEIIGSKILDPGDYLDGSADPGGRVPPGERFTAVVRVEAPSPEATGFKLNVCYREPGNRVRCATQDFKDQ